MLCSGLLALAAGCDDGPAGPGGGPAPLRFDNFQAAAVVIGQVDKTSRSANAGGTTGAVGLHTPVGAGAGALYVPDTFNNRVLGFDGVPTADGTAASFVLGQPDFTSNTFGTTAQDFHNPDDCAVSGGKLFLVDSGNHRVLIWNSLPTANVPADVVVGQADFTSNSAGTTQSSLSAPWRVTVAGGKMFVADTSNNRVLIWNTIPTTNGAPADVVVGQTDFTTNSGGLTASKFGIPRGMWADGARLVIGDGINDRVLIWNTIPATHGAPADVVVGAADFTTAGSNAPSATSIGDPYGVASDGTSLFVCDQGFNRVLMFSPIPTTHGAAASRVLGQDDFTNSDPNDADQDGVSDGAPTERTLSGPFGVAVNGSRLLVSDLSNHRVLIFNSR